jgi:hypothetical protein
MGGASTGPSGIFLSYRREETTAQTGRLYDQLSNRFGEHQVFMDIDSIALGADFEQAIREAVGSCRALLVMLGSGWLDIGDDDGSRRLDDPSDYVRLEIEAALERDIVVIPILVNGADLPPANALPDALRPLVRRQALPLGDASFRTDVAKLSIGSQAFSIVGTARRLSHPQILHGRAWLRPASPSFGGEDSSSWESYGEPKPPHSYSISRCAQMGPR